MRGWSQPPIKTINMSDSIFRDDLNCATEVPQIHVNRRTVDRRSSYMLNKFSMI